MSLTTLLAATAIAFVLMGLELWVHRRHGQTTYTWDGVVSDLSCSLGNLVFMGAFGITGYLGYDAIQSWVPWRLFAGGTAMDWVIGLLLLDLVQYAKHRAAHRIGLLWAIHEVHHQPVTINFGSAQRSGWLEAVKNLPTAMCLAALGVPVELTAASFAITAMYQLFMHTELVGTLGWLDRVMVTPSVHRVHHACNERYLDTNFGGILAIWDVLFGTWAEEVEAPIYGTVKGLDSYDPLAANLSPWQDLLARARTAPTWWGALETLVRPPAWCPIRRTERSVDCPTEAHVAPRRVTDATGMVLAFSATMAAVYALYGLVLDPALEVGVGIAALVGLHGMWRAAHGLGARVLGWTLAH